MTAEASNASQSLSEDDLARFASLRELLWTDYDDFDTCAPTDKKLLLEDWDWITSLVKEGLLITDTAAGIGTSFSFSLVIESESKGALLMIGPMHVPAELGTTTEQIKALFRELRDC